MYDIICDRLKVKPGMKVVLISNILHKWFQVKLKSNMFNLIWLEPKTSSEKGIFLNKMLY